MVPLSGPIILYQLTGRGSGSQNKDSPTGLLTKTRPDPTSGAGFRGRVLARSTWVHVIRHINIIVRALGLLRYGMAI